MKLKLLPFIFLGIVLANMASMPSNLPQSACKIVEQVQKQENSMKTLAIVNFEENASEKLIEDVRKCLPMEIAVIAMDAMSLDLNMPRIHNVDFVVVLLDVFDQRKMDKFFYLLYDNAAKPFLDHNSKFLVIASKDKMNLDMLKHFLNGLSILNFAIIFEDSRGGVLVDFNNNEENPKQLVSIDSRTIARIYPNHLKDLKGHQHVIYATEEFTKFRMKNGVLKSKFLYFLDIIEQKENSKMAVMNVVSGNYNALLDFLTQAYHRRQFQMILSTVWTLDAPKLMTYEETGLCPFVPKPEKVSSTFKLKRPFDTGTWIMIIVSMIACMILWRFSGSSSSVWFIPFFFWAFAQGQGINFPTKRKIFIAVLQILVFMLFVLGNAYQGVITSIIIEPDQIHLFKSFEELLESDYKILIAPNREEGIMSFPGYEQAKDRIGPINNELTKADMNEMYKNRTAVLLSCEVAKYLISTRNMTQFYVINSNMFSTYVQFQVGYMNKYLVRWQQIMDWCFEAGLPEEWERKDNSEKIFKDNDETVDDIIDLEDLEIVFKALMLGYFLGLMALICEIIWHKYGTRYLRRREYLKWNRRIEAVRKRAWKRVGPMQE